MIGAHDCVRGTDVDCLALLVPRQIGTSHKVAEESDQTLLLSRSRLASPLLAHTTYQKAETKEAEV